MSLAEPLTRSEADRPARRDPDRVATALRGSGEVLLTAGLVVLLFVAWLLWGTDLENARTQAALRDDLTRTWAAPPSAPDPAGPGVDGPAPTVDPAAPGPDPAVPVPLGEGVAVLRIPRLGPGYQPVVVNGVSTADLQKGPGHIPGTAAFGAVGNSVISGHRTTYGKPFSRIDELRPGDAVVVETRDTYYTYRMTSSEVVSPQAVEVTLPVPHRPGATPSTALLTFTTCTPRFTGTSRLIVYSELESTAPKSAGPPAALAGT